MFFFYRQWKVCLTYDVEYICSRGYGPAVLKAMADGRINTFYGDIFYLTVVMIVDNPA